MLPANYAINSATNIRILHFVGMSETRRRKPKSDDAGLLAEDNTVTNQDSVPPSPALVFCCGCLFTVLFLVLVLVSSSLISFALMDSYTWGYQSEDIKALPIVSLFFPPVRANNSFVSCTLITTHSKYLQKIH